MVSIQFPIKLFPVEMGITVAHVPSGSLFWHILMAALVVMSPVLLLKVPLPSVKLFTGVLGSLGTSWMGTSGVMHSSGLFGFMVPLAALHASWKFV